MWNPSDITLIIAYQTSHAKLREATVLCSDDPIKREMVAYINDDFNAVHARSAGIEILVKKGDLENKKFIIQEMKEVIKHNYEIAKKIRTTLEELEE